jgi:hypothetical protein
LDDYKTILILFILKIRIKSRKYYEIDEKVIQIVIPAEKEIYITNKNTGFLFSPLLRGWE